MIHALWCPRWTRLAFTAGTSTATTGAWPSLHHGVGLPGVQDGDDVAEGWPEWINIPSKVGQVAAMRILARDQQEPAEQDGRLIAAVCPGLVDTEASRPWFEDMSQALSPDEAAADVLALAFDPIRESFYGQLIQHSRVIPWT